MPKAFEECQAAGGKMRTMRLSQNRYVRVCIKDGKVYRGHTKTKKGKS